MKVRDEFMRVYSIYDKEFEEYGQILSDYDYSELFSCMKNEEMPKSGIVYKASVSVLEQCKVFDDMKNRGFGGYDIQIGYVCGKNSDMNCLEYHKSSEFNISLDDVILILGRVQDIAEGTYDSSLCRAFLIPAGVGVELYATTLHYAPINVKEGGYQVICVLPRGTNDSKPDFQPRTTEDKMCFGINKWLITHAQSGEVGAHIGIKGKNININDLENVI